MSLEALPPAAYLILGALVLPLLPGGLRKPAALFFPALALVVVWRWPESSVITARFYAYDLVICRVDPLSRVFGLVFSLITLVGGIYAWHEKDTRQRVAALLYAGGALAVTFAGDLFTLLLGWEGMAVASTFLIWARGTQAAAAAGMRYLLVHLLGGSALLAGIAMVAVSTGSVEIRFFEEVTGPGPWLILAGVALNAALPPLHAWLPDSYPQATVTGAVFLSAFTTKSAVYVLARLFPGWEILMWGGVMMALYGVVYAVLVNDIRQILAYHIISQVGYMVAGIGLGTALALNGTTAHAFSHILYKALLFMGAGAVLEATGRSRLTELGGLGRHMPWVVALYMIGAFSISGFPLFNGFISKSIIVSAAGEEHRYTAKFLLILASVGTFLSIGLKLPYGTWFGRDKGLRPSRPIPANMLVAMAVLAILCTLFGVRPQLLYQWLPNPMEYQPYMPLHLAEAVQLIIFTFAAFWLLRTKVVGEPLIALDTDWFYRKPARWLRTVLVEGILAVFDRCEAWMHRLAVAITRVASNPFEVWQRWRLPRRPFDPDEDRFPVGKGVLVALAVVVGLAWWAVLS